MIEEKVVVEKSINFFVRGIDKHQEEPDMHTCLPAPSGGFLGPRMCLCVYPLLTLWLTNLS